MTEILPIILEHIHDQGIDKIAAVVNRTNKSAIKVLERSGFKIKDKFDILQDIYIALN